jgi:hypothetical protein
MKLNPGWNAPDTSTAPAQGIFPRCRRCLAEANYFSTTQLSQIPRC